MCNKSIKDSNQRLQDWWAFLSGFAMAHVSSCTKRPIGPAMNVTRRAGLIGTPFFSASKYMSLPAP